MKKNKVKPTELQKETFKHLHHAKTLQEAMLKGGYSKNSSLYPKANFLDREGTKSLINQYREELRKAGVSIEVLAEVEASGLFDENGAVRLGYLKENKKSLGLSTEEPIQQTNIQIVFTRGQDETNQG